MRIVHLSSVHHWRDTRIFVKMCRLLAAAGHEVTLLTAVAEPPPAEFVDGVRLINLPAPSDRLRRAWKTGPKLLAKAAELSADLYHFHDPEFLRLAPAFQRRVGRPVIYDAHEDVREQILYKTWLPRPLRRIVAGLCGWIEDRTVAKLAGVITATPTIAKRFCAHPRLAVVHNFPLRDELATAERSGGPTRRRFAYVGALSEVRGVTDMISALPLVGSDARLALGGPWQPVALREQCQKLAGWPQVDDLGFLNRDQVRELLAESAAGLAVLRPTGNYVNAYAVKMFEYMAASLPVVVSDFSLWRQIVAEADCGLTVPPQDPSKLAGALRFILDHPQDAARWGQNGRRAVEEKYNFEAEFAKLQSFYRLVVAAGEKQNHA